jgi:sterol 3beta-glucosyltransferase
MNIGIQTWGSNGDIRPMLALADGLQKAGHSVTLLVSSIDNKDYSEICGLLKINYRKVPAHIAFDMQQFARRTFRMNTLQWLNALLNEAFFPYEEDLYHASRQLAAEHDCLIGHHFLYPLKMAALQQHKPFISITLCHAAIEVNSQPPFRFPNLGPTLNRWQWQLMQYIFDFALKKPLSKLWQAENMSAFKHVYPGLLTSDQLNLVAVDPLFCMHHNEWKPLHQTCGFLNLPDSAEHWQLPRQLEKFVNQGDAPVYMTFGSLQQAVPEWSMELFIEAANLAGCRAIIQTSSSRYPAESQQDNIYFIGKHPHQPLFKHCAAVVHHGGAGTTHATTRSGRPSIVVPFMDEQLFWACQLQKLALAGKPLPANKATAQQLAERIHRVLKTQQFHDQARNYGIAMRNHDGVAQAIKLLHNYINCNIPLTL